MSNTVKYQHTHTHRVMRTHWWGVLNFPFGDACKNSILYRLLWFMLFVCFVFAPYKNEKWWLPFDLSNDLDGSAITVTSLCLISLPVSVVHHHISVKHEMDAVFFKMLKKNMDYKIRSPFTLQRVRVRVWTTTTLFYGNCSAEIHGGNFI